MFRIGQSVDIHKLVSDRKLIIGGVTIPHNKGLLGHSDADVLLHVIIESIIGALALGDIGKHFSDSDAQYKDISSVVLLEKTYCMMKEKNYAIQNLDCLIMIEKPMMGPYIDQMINIISNTLHCSKSDINIKATRGEGLGFVGQELGVQAQSVVLLRKEENKYE